MDAPPKNYTLPDLHARCPWPTSLNIHFSTVSAASSAWALSYDVFKDCTEQKKRDVCLKRGGELLCAYAYPYAGPDHLRAACDFVNILFTIDEVSDDQDGVGAYQTGQIALRALRDEPYDDGSELCRMTKDFRQRLLHLSPGDDTFNRFVGHFASYVGAVSTEAKYRTDNVVLNSAAYDVIRRENSAVRCCFGLIGCMLKLELPDAVFEHPLFQKMHLAAVDMVTWANDVYSYDMEHAMGHLTNNILTVLQHEYGVSLQRAADLVGAHWRGLVAAFEEAKILLPSFGDDLDPTVAEHIMAMETWVAGNLDWSFASPRYFGEANEIIRKTLVVHMSPIRYA